MADRESDGPGGGGPQTFQTRYSGDEPVMEAIVRGLAAVQGVSPAAVEPLHGSIDIDALESLFDTPVVFDDDLQMAIEFSASQHRITVRTDGQITIREPAPGGEEGPPGPGTDE